MSAAPNRHEQARAADRSAQARTPRWRPLVFAAIFWALAGALLTLDWRGATPHNRFDEPLPWQLGHEKSGESGHCAAPLTR